MKKMLWVLVGILCTAVVGCRLGFEPPGSGVIAGIVVGQDGKPLSGVCVLVVSESEVEGLAVSFSPDSMLRLLSGVVESDENGFFKVSYLTPGKYYLLAGMGVTGEDEGMIMPLKFEVSDGELILPELFLDDSLFVEVVLVPAIELLEEDGSPWVENRVRYFSLDAPMVLKWQCPDTSLSWAVLLIEGTDLVWYRADVEDSLVFPISAKEEAILKDSTTYRWVVVGWEEDDGEVRGVYSELFKGRFTFGEEGDYDEE